MNAMEEMKQKIINEVEEKGQLIIWKGTLEKYIEILQEEENEFDLPGYTPVEVSILRN